MSEDVNPGMPRPIKTLQQHILEQQNNHPTASGGFSWLLSGITLATKIIAAQVRRAGLADMLGAAGRAERPGRDACRNSTCSPTRRCCTAWAYRGNVGVMASEENEEPVVVDRDREHGNYVVVFDPLDGSSNIDVNVSVGTIFSILRARDRTRAARATR